MTDVAEVWRVALDTCESTPGPERDVLFVDRDPEIEAVLARRFPGSRITSLETAGIAPEDLWLAEPGVFQFIVVPAERSSRDLYRMLSLAVRTLAVGGLVFLPSHGSVKDRARFEASEILVAAQPGLQRVHTRAGVFMLRRVA